MNIEVSQSPAAESAVPVVASAAPAPAETTWELWRWSVEQYHEMVRTAIISEDDPVELLEGWIVKKMTKSPRHRLATRLLRDALQRHIPQGWDVDSQDPLTLSASEPEPDATIVRGGPRDYADRHPGARDVALVAEVSDSSLGAIGASRRQFTPPPALPFIGSSTCWRGIEVYSNPIGSAEGADYATCESFGVEDRVPLVVDGLSVAEIPAREILP